MAAVGAVVALALAGCADGAEGPPSRASGTAGSRGITQISDIFGPACRRLPPSGEGSPLSMLDDPVATAASRNPLLGALSATVREAGLVDALNEAPAVTVLAPSDDAFAAIPQAQLDALRRDPEMLRRTVRNHVSSTRYDAEGLVDVGVLQTLDGDTVAVGGTADAPTFARYGDPTMARTLCGDIPTRNATVFVIDRVLLPVAGTSSATSVDAPAPPS